MTRDNSPPITLLPVLLTAIAGALEASQEQLKHLRKAVTRPYSLDDKTVNRVIQSTTAQNKTLIDEKEICSKWKKTTLTAEQLKMINQVEANLVEMEKLNQQIIALATSCKKHTIEKILNKDDGELALSHLMGKLAFSNAAFENDDEDDEDDDEDEFDSDIIYCEACGEPVARVIFAPDATSVDELEACAEMMADSIQDMNVPTWIMGKEKSMTLNNEFIGEAFVMQDHPEREAAKYVPSLVFDLQLDDLADSHCEEHDEDDEDEFLDEEDSNEKMTTLNQVITKALWQLQTITELNTSSKQESFNIVRLFLIGMMTTAVDLVEDQAPGTAIPLYAELEAAAKAGGLRSIVDFQQTYSERNYSVSNIEEDDMETAMNYVGQQLNTTLIKSVNELPRSLRKEETFLRGIEVLLGNLLQQKFDNPHQILDSLCEHVHRALDSLQHRRH